MNDYIQGIFQRINDFTDQNPDIVEAIKEGYEVGFYDEESGAVVTKELVKSELKVRVVMESYMIPKAAGKETNCDVQNDSGG